MVVEQVTLQEAADELGVHYMTAYRYVRTGRLKAEKQRGVWSVALADLHEFAATKDDDARRQDVVPELLESRLVAADENASFQILEAALASGASVDEAYVDLLGSAMTEIGRKWSDGTLSIADEHVATSTAMRVLGRLSPQVARRGRSRGTVILAAVPGDNHTLPTAILRDLLRSRGFEVHDLGANTPAESLVARAEITNDLIAIGLAATLTDNDPAITATLSALADLDVPVILGGAAIEDEQHANGLGPCRYSSDPKQALAHFAAAHAERSSD